MKTLNRYFTRDAKALKLQFEIREHYKQIRALNRKQRELYKLMNQDSEEVRRMFNDGVFKSYGDMTMQFFNKLYR